MIYHCFLFVCYLFITAFFAPLYAESLIIGGSGADLGTFKLLIKEFSQSHPNDEFKVIPSMGSRGGIKALKYKKLNIALTSRALRDNEVSSKLQVIHYADTPLAFATTNTSPQQNVTKTQINQFYTGTLKQWADGSPVRPILRPFQDSDTQILINIMAEFQESFIQSYQRKGIPVALTDQDSADMISNIPGAIGTATLSIILGENRSIKALDFDDITPTVENLRNKTYPMYKELYLVYNKNNELQILNNFISFIYSDKGQSILVNTGHLIIQ